LDEGYEVDVYEQTINSAILKRHFALYVQDTSGKEVGYSTRISDRKVFMVTFGLPGQEDSELFYWNDVKNYYIPFLQMLERRYKLHNFSVNGQVGEVYFNTDTSYKFNKLEQVIEDNVENTGLWGLGLMISDKK
jgi:hypothetical protein